MRLQSPIKQGTFRNWNHNSTLHSLADMFKCQTQGFGGNAEMYAPFGLIGHNGLDFGYENGTEVFASHDGDVVYSEDSAKGLGAVVTTDGFKTIYWHMSSFIGSNRPVKIGELIGIGDSTGFSTGPHLHYGLKLLDNTGNVLNRDNGYDGAVDPTQYLVWYGMSEKEVRQLQALEGYHDETGVAYWTGKPLADYLAARLADKVKTINATL